MAVESLSEWRRIVLERDHVCQSCGRGDAPGHRLEAAHILSRMAYPAVRDDPENGILLGKSCHDRADARRKEFRRWVNERWPGRVDRLRAKCR